VQQQHAPVPDASQVVQALPSILEGLRAKGFELVTLSRMVSDGERPRE
jgi:hypothetical protein